LRVDCTRNRAAAVPRPSGDSYVDVLLRCHSREDGVPGNGSARRPGPTPSRAWQTQIWHLHGNPA
jgi:hypothetical protein